MEQRLDMTQRQSLMARLYQIVQHYPVDPVEFIASVQDIAYGAMLLSPLNTFASTKSFAVANRYVTEDGAGAVFVLVGLVWLLGLLREHRPTRLVCSLATTFLFTFWAVMLAQSNIDGGGWLTYSMFAALGAWSFWRQCIRDQ